VRPQFTIQYRGPELVWATGRLMSPDLGFGIICLLYYGHLAVSANSLETFLSRTSLRRLVKVRSVRHSRQTPVEFHRRHHHHHMKIYSVPITYSSHRCSTKVT